MPLWTAGPRPRRHGRIRCYGYVPTTGGGPAGSTTPEEMLAESHAICYGIGLFSLIGRRGGTARRLTVTATITRGPAGIQITRSHLEGRCRRICGNEDADLRGIARAVEDRCTIFVVLRSNVAATSEVTAVEVGLPDGDGLR